MLSKPCQYQTTEMYIARTNGCLPEAKSASMRGMERWCASIGLKYGSLYQDVLNNACISSTANKTGILRTVRYSGLQRFLPTYRVLLPSAMSTCWRSSAGSLGSISVASIFVMSEPLMALRMLGLASRIDLSSLTEA